MRYRGQRRGLIWLGTSFIIAIGAAGVNLHGAGRGGSDKLSLKPAVDNGEILLVRAWNPKSGELTGWMPLHRVAITLQQVTPEGLSFDLNDAVSIKLPTRAGEFDAHRLPIAPEMITVQGQKYLPIEREPNLVRIKKCLFYVKSIIFGESKYRNPTKTD